MGRAPRRPREPRRPALLAAETFADIWSELLPALPDDYECHMTCTEAESAAEFMRAFGRPATANAILRAHTEHDEPGDSHFVTLPAVVSTGDTQEGTRRG